MAQIDKSHQQIREFQICSVFFFVKIISVNACNLGTTGQIDSFPASSTQFAKETSTEYIFSSAILFSNNCRWTKNCYINRDTSDSSCNLINLQIHYVQVAGTSYDETQFTSSNTGCTVNSPVYSCPYTFTCDLYNDYFIGAIKGTYTSNTITISTKFYCSTVSCYAKTSVSNPSYYTYTVEQYSGTSNINSQADVLITEYFTIADSTCSFSTCNMYAGTTLDTSVTVDYSGSGSAAKVAFKIVTQSSFSIKNLKLGCSFSISTNIAYSSNSIAFTVNPCTLTGIIPVSNSYTYIQALYTGSANEINLPVSNYFTGQSSTCYFYQCWFQDSSQVTSSIVSVQITGLAPLQKFTFTTITTSAFTVKTLYLKCLVASSTSTYVTNSNPINFTVIFCQYTSQLPPSYTLEQYQNGNLVSYKDLNISSFIASSYQNCTLSNCSLVDSLGKTPTFANFTYNPSSSAYTLNISTKFLTSRFEKGSTSIKLNCSKIEGGYQQSQMFSIEVICSKTSVQIQAPSSLKEVTYYLINNNIQATYTYDNFTSSNATACPILSHKLATSQSNLTSPSYIALVEGKQSFQIQNISMSSKAFMYPIYIVATAQGGAVLIQKVFIYNFVDCNDDLISLSQSSPDRKDPNLNLYVKQNKISVLQISQTFDSQFEANIYKRFTSILSEFCPFSKFRIKKVFCNQKELTDYQSFLSISDEGLFKISKQDNKEAQKCQVYIEAFNTKKWGGDEQYLVQIYLQQKVQDKIGLPQLIEEPKQINIDLSSSRQNYFSIKLPKVNENTCQINLINKNQLNFLSVTFDAKTLSSNIKIDKRKIKTAGEYSLVIQLVNAKGLYQYYTIQINITQSYSQIVSASIASIDQFGVAIVKFSDQMILNKTIPWINYAKQNLLPFNNSWINQTNTVIKVLPSKGRYFDEGFNQSSLNLNWNVIQVTNTSIAFQIIFENPIQISPQIAQDKLQIFFNGSKDLLVSQANFQSLDQAYQNLTYNIKKQLTDSFQIQSLRTAGKYMNKLLLAVLILSIFLNLIGQGCVENMLLMFRSLQIVMHLPILQVVFPANALAFFKYIIKLVQFDVLEDLPLFEYLSFIQYDQNAQPQVIGQMIDIGYDNRNAFSGLKLITLVLFLFFTRIFLSLCTGFFVAYKGWKNKYLNKTHCYLVKGLYFNQIIRVSMEAYFEFYLIGHMNYQTANLTLSGEILGVLETVFVLFMIFIVLTCLSVFIIFKTQEQLEEKGNKNIKFFIGELYESTKIDSKLQRAYTLFFLLRRFSFLSIATFIQDDNFAGIQIISVLLMNLAWMIYIGYAKAQKEQLLNKIEKWNELFVQFSTLILPLFTSYVQDLEIQYMYGWFMVASFSMHLIFNLIFVFRHFAKIIKQYCLLIFNYANYFYDKKKFKFPGNNEDKVQEEQEQEKSPEEILRLQILEKQKMKGKSLVMKYKMKLFQLANQSAISNIPIPDQLDQNLEEEDKKQINQPIEDVKQEDQSKIDESVQQQDESTSNLNSNKIIKNYSLKEQNKMRKTDHQNNYLQNFRKKRDEIFQVRESHDDQTQQEFREFLLSHKDLFESCVQENNSLEDMGKDLRYLTFKETDSYMTINSKEIKISQYVQFLLLNYSHLKDPETEFLTFDQDLKLFSDYLSDKKKNQ